HGASHLARHANRSPAPSHRSSSTLDLIPRFASVAALAAISLRHPHRLHRLPVGEFHEIPDRAVARNKLARNRRRPHAPAFFGKSSAIFEWQRRNLVQPLNLLPIHRIKEL